MIRLFVDTSAWAALADASDDQHHAALTYQKELPKRRPRLTTTNYVLDELYTLLLMNIGYAKAIAFKRKLDLMIQQKTLEVIWVSQEIAEQAWTVFERYNTDKLWSFTDCVSYVVMQSQNLTEVFGFDHHFAQMGFVCCP